MLRLNLNGNNSGMSISISSETKPLIPLLW